MKKGLILLWTLIVSLLLCSCRMPHLPEHAPTQPQDSVTEPETSDTTEESTEHDETEPVTTKPEETQPETTEPVTTEPETEPAPKPTEPVETKPVETTKPTESTKPGDNTKPATKPTKPTEPKPTEPVTKPTEKPTEPETEPSPKGWAVIDNKHYYLKADGSRHTGWLSVDGSRYYFLEDGSMATGCVKVPGEGKRYFASTGKEVILVNPWNYVPDDYSVKLSKYGDYKVAASCLDDLKDMIADCKSAGSKAIVVSAYRSHSYQAGLYERRVQRFLDKGYSQEDAEREAAMRVAIPGTSEHQLGLAVDIVDVNYQTLDKKQEDTAAQKWLMANSWKYGFILRYPNEKSDVTGIIYEPWHYRYVGKELAAELHENGLCLEEYFSSLTD